MRLRKFGRDLALGWRKRGISTADMASRLFVSRDTLWRLERGDPPVSMGTLAKAAFVFRFQTGWEISAHLARTNWASAWMNAGCQ